MLSPEFRVKFAFWNIWFWGAHHFILTAWWLINEKSFNKFGFFYLDHISIAALWLSAVTWYAAERSAKDAKEVNES